MSDYGFHWSPCRRDGGIGGLVALVVLVVVVANGHAIETGLTDLLEAALAVAGVVVAGVVAAVVLVIRARRRRDGRALPVVVTSRVVPARRGAAVGPPRADMPALPRGDASAHSRIDAQPHVVTSRVSRPRCSRRADRRQ